MASKQKEYKVRDPRNGRDAALTILLLVCENRKKSHHAVREVLDSCPGLSRRDKALAKRIAEGSLEYLIRLDCLLGRYLKRPLSFLKPEIRGILRISFYQLLYMDKVPDSAVCNEAVELAKLHGLLGLSGLVNGVLRAAVRDKQSGSSRLYEIKDPAVDLAVPKWLFRKLSSDFGTDQAREIAGAWLRERPVTVRLNLSRASEEEICGLLREEGVEFAKADMEGFFSEYGIRPAPGQLPVMLQLSGISGLSGLSAFQKGLLQPQDMSSAVPAVLAAPREGSFILDVCAAPGGKSLQLADLLRGTGLVEARDLSRQKVRLIEENISRSGFQNIRARLQDALVPHEESYCRADILMADLPCSGLGIAARKPDIKWNVEPCSITELQALQRDILRVVYRYVKPGGRLVYSTCTLTPEENEQNVEWMAEELKLVPVQSVRIFPSREHDGFFAALLKRSF